jgi:hypothetical protein
MNNLTHIDPPRIGIKVIKKQLHVIPLSIPLTSKWHINIVHSKDKVHTLVDIIIIDLICANLLFQTTFTHGFTTSKATQTKAWSYQNPHPKDQFLPPTLFFKKYLHNILNFYTCVPPMHKF